MTKDEMKEEEWYVIFNMNCQYEICRMCPKSGLFKGSYEECEKWIKQKKKEEKKDEMKNKISLALKDPKLQQGFEIICKENAELKADNDARKFAMAMSEKVEKQLREENAELKDVIEGYKKIAKWCDNCDKIAELKSENQKWKDEWQEQVQKATDEGYARTLQTIQLSKAKNLLAKWVELFKPKSKTALPTPIQVDTEQFLNGEGCPDCFCEDCTKEDCKSRQIGLVEKVK